MTSIPLFQIRRGAIYEGGINLNEKRDPLSYLDMSCISSITDILWQVEEMALSLYASHIHCYVTLWLFHEEGNLWPHAFWAAAMSWFIQQNVTKAITCWFWVQPVRSFVCFCFSHSVLPPCHATGTKVVQSVGGETHADSHDQEQSCLAEHSRPHSHEEAQQEPGKPPSHACLKLLTHRTVS